jgi:hypothetical protein
MEIEALLGERVGVVSGVLVETQIFQVGISVMIKVHKPGFIKRKVIFSAQFCTIPKSTQYSVSFGYSLVVLFYNLLILCQNISLLQIINYENCYKYMIV